MCGFITDNAYTDDMTAQRNYQVRSGREARYGSRFYYYQQRPYPYYERRYYGRGLLDRPFGW